MTAAVEDVASGPSLAEATGEALMHLCGLALGSVVGFCLCLYRAQDKALGYSGCYDVREATRTSRLLLPLLPLLQELAFENKLFSPPASLAKFCFQNVN